MTYYDQNANHVGGFRAILAVSADGFVARGPDDDMKWTGPLDKAFFKMYTLVNNDPIVVGWKTAQLLPKLPGRHLWRVRSKEMPGMKNGMDDGKMQCSYKWIKEEISWGAQGYATCIGGPTLIRELFKDNMIVEMVVCHIKTVKLFNGIPFEFQSELDKMKKYPILKSKEHPELEVFLYRKE